MIDVVGFCHVVLNLKLSKAAIWRWKIYSIIASLDMEHMSS